MMRLINICVIAGLVFAAAYVYKIKFDSTRQAERLAKLRLDNRREADAIAALRAEWSKLDNPARLQDLVRQPSGVDKWNGPYVKDPANLKDAWGNDYRYQVPGTNKPFDLVSLGADNQPGGEGENRDVTN